jgi:acyl carrier protein
MKGSHDAAFKADLKALIVKEADKPVDPATLDDDGPLFGPNSSLQLDSLDALQISMALQLKYGVRIEDPKEARRVMISINALADFLRPT